jgi:ABC-type transporter Mla subunit MlaD
MRSVTTDAISRLNAGAETLYIAASDFAKAGTAVKGSLDAAAGVTSQLSQAAGSVVSATRSLEGTVADYRTTRDTVAQMVERLSSVIESCRREAAVTEDVLTRIEGATEGLAKAHTEADGYMQRVSEVLGEGFDQFSQNLTKVVEGSNTEFYKQLSLATGLLREGIQELESTLAAVPARHVG